MNKTLLLLCALICNYDGSGQAPYRELINKANTELEPDLSGFNACIANSDLNNCVNTIIKKADNEYKKFIVGGVLYSIDPNQSLKLHEEAFQSNNLNPHFALEYALELHRKGEYQKASELYKLYSELEPQDFRAHVWLADCYINNNQIEESLASWKKVDYAKNHTSIDFAIYAVYGKTDQFSLRNQYRSAIENGDVQKVYPLIYLDLNWERDWWNTTSQDDFLKKDIELAKVKLGSSSREFKIIDAYSEIKRLEKQESPTTMVKSFLQSNQIIVEDYSFVPFGKITSDLLRICFISNLISPQEFHKKRGQELLDFARLTKDAETLNIYAYLQATVDGKVRPEIDRLGWKEFNDERFAISYFIGKADKNQYDDTELAEAIKDFPNSAKLYWVKANCGRIEGKPIKPLLVELIKREFRGLSSDQNKFSMRLNSYFNSLEKEK